MSTHKPFIGITLDYELPSSQGDALRGYSMFPWYAIREAYASCIHDAGGLPIFIPFHHEDIDAYLDKIDGLLIPGGRDINPSLYGDITYHPTTSVTPKRPEFELACTKKALERNMPILGICGGHQIINVALGGTLIQHIPDMVANALTHRDQEQPMDTRHPITIYENTYLYSIAKGLDLPCIVNSNHHQSIKDLGKGLRVSAVASDTVIEAIESTDHHFVLGVQWHPEYLTYPIDTRILNAFLKACHR